MGRIIDAAAGRDPCPRRFGNGGSAWTRCSRQGFGGHAVKARGQLVRVLVAVFGLKGANIGVASLRREGWEDLRHGLLLPLSRHAGSARRAGA